MLTFIVEISINVACIISFKKYLKLKQMINKVGNNEKLDVKLSNKERKQTLMVISMSCVSFSAHSVYLTSVIYYYYSYDLIANILGASGEIAVMFKNFFNFFFLYAFNFRFRKNFKLCILSLSNKANSQKKI